MASNGRLKVFLKQWGILLVLVLVKLILHFLWGNNYEIHRDGYLYLSLGEHPAAGYISVPPFIAFLGNLSKFLFGDTLFAVRFFPALAGAFSIVLTGLIVKELRGGVFAMFLAGLAFLVSPVFLRSNTLFQPVAFNQFYWLLSCYLIIRLINTRNPRIWIFLFIIWGLAFLNKYSIVFFVVAFFISIFFTKHRKLLFSWYFVIGSITGMAIILPNVVWHFLHHFPIITHMKELYQEQLVHVDPGGFLLMQILMTAPVFFIWIAGLYRLLLRRESEDYRIIGFLYPALIILLILLKGKFYYSAGIYPVLLAAGSVMFESWFRKKKVYLRYILVALVVIGAIPILPLSLPVLTMDKMLKYSEILKDHGFAEPFRWEDGRIHPLPQDYADMTGWKEMAEMVAAKYHSMSEEECATCIIFAENYGQAGAVNFYRKELELPEVLSFNASFLLWLPDTAGFNCVLYLGYNKYLHDYFNEVYPVDTLSNKYSREAGVPLYYCSGPRDGFREWWKVKVSEMKKKY